MCALFVNTNVPKMNDNVASWNDEEDEECDDSDSENIESLEEKNK